MGYNVVTQDWEHTIQEQMFKGFGNDRGKGYTSVTSWEEWVFSFAFVDGDYGTLFELRGDNLKISDGIKYLAEPGFEKRASIEEMLG